MSNRPATPKIQHAFFLANPHVSPVKCGSPGGLKKPELASWEINSAIRDFASRGDDEQLLISTLHEDAEVIMNSRRINKSQLAKATGLKSKRIDVLLHELRLICAKLEHGKPQFTAQRA